MARPQHSKEPVFQLMMAAVHGFCAVVNLSAAVYHMRRTREEGTPKDVL